MTSRPWLLYLIAALTCASSISCNGVDAVDVQGAGATFPAPLYKRWFLQYYQQHPEVRENAVTVYRKTSGDRELVAIVAPRCPGSISPEGLRDFLREKLPEVMVPSRFMLVDALPRTPNGKIDRQALSHAPAAESGLIFHPDLPFVGVSSPTQQPTSGTSLPQSLPRINRFPLLRQPHLSPALRNR